jgi:peptidyl-prolyl cis-trans isomerase A (cyclophilin A)
MRIRHGVREFARVLGRWFVGEHIAPVGLEMLEGRSLLQGTPLPTLGDLENVNNSVVRLETNFGDIDIELFNSQAPITVANFLNYVTSGRYDNVIFHRHAINPNPFVLQGGGFYYEDGTGLTSVETDAPIVRETTGRSNLARTVAMARTNVLNSATSQFFINYVNNTFLDPTSSTNGYAVFGRVIQGWNVVTTIQALRSLDMTANPSFAGADGAAAMNEFPVANSYVTGQPIGADQMVRIINAEVIKPANVSGFFEQRLIMPEGFRSPNTTETVELYNPNAASATYQVIVRYETGLRDRVVASGTLSPGGTLRVRLSDSGDSTLDAVRPNTPYSVVVETALPSGTPDPRPISASMNRVDYNASTSQGFFNPAGWTDDQLRTWDIAHIERGPLSREYLTWTNLSDDPGIVTVALTTGTSPQVFRFDLAPYRRGGMALADYSVLAAGIRSARITSTVPIVVFASDWDIPAPGQAVSTSYTPGFGTMGLPGGGATAGGVADVVMRANHLSTISLYNPGSTFASVNLRFWRTGRAQSEPPISRVQVLPGGGRFDYTLVSGDLGIPLGETFTVTYSSGSVPIVAQYTFVDTEGRNLSGTKRNDGDTLMLTTRLAPTTYFPDGFLDSSRLDGGTQSERITLFNVFANGTVTFSYTIRYHFTDGTAIDAFTGTLAPNARVEFATLSSNAVRTKISAGSQFQHYAISVISSATSGSTTTPVSPLAMLTRQDTGTGRMVTTSGQASGFGFAFNDPMFQ